MAILLITHDLGVVANIAHDVAVLYRGRLVEAGPRDTVMRAPGHAYLRALLHAVPRFDMAPGERLTPIRPARAEIPPVQPQAKPAGPLLRVEGVSKSYTLRSGRFWQKPRIVQAVSDVSLSLAAGETLGLVGESGSGKTTVSKMVMRALEPDSGRILFDDGSGPRDVHGLSGDALFAYRRTVQFVFQDPYASLDPRMTVRQILSEPMEIHGVPAAERRARCRELMAMVGLEASGLGRYPHAFSGGQRQRIGIARALAPRPRLLVLDEPVSALDVSVQAQILNLLKDLQAALGLSYLIVSHNLAVIDYMADTISVMCRGRIVEEAPRAALFRRPVHPTRARCSPPCRIRASTIRSISPRSPATRTIRPAGRHPTGSVPTRPAPCGRSSRATGSGSPPPRTRRPPDAAAPARDAGTPAPQGAVALFDRLGYDLVPAAPTGATVRPRRGRSPRCWNPPPRSWSGISRVRHHAGWRSPRQRGPSGT